jgi:hypothetical protein
MLLIVQKDEDRHLLKIKEKVNYFTVMLTSSMK